MTKTEILNRILDATCKASGITREEIENREKSLKLNTARGVYYLVAHKRGFKHVDVAALIGRSRVSCIITTNVYLSYYSTGDILTTRLYKKVCDILQNQ